MAIFLTAEPLGNMNKTIVTKYTPKKEELSIDIPMEVKALVRQADDIINDPNTENLFIIVGGYWSLSMSVSTCNAIAYQTKDCPLSFILDNGSLVPYHSAPSEEMLSTEAIVGYLNDHTYLDEYVVKFGGGIWSSPVSWQDVLIMLNKNNGFYTGI